MTPATLRAIIADLSPSEIASIRSMEWTGEYYQPPKLNRKKLAAIGALDPLFNFSVTTFGEELRSVLDGANS